MAESKVVFMAESKVVVFGRNVSFDGKVHFRHPPFAHDES